MNNNRNQRFKMICAAGDGIVEKTGANPSEVSGYAVAQAAFGKKPNGDFYIMFEEWLKLRRAVPGAPLADMPAEAATELEEWTDHLKAQIMQRVTGIVREVGGSFEHTTAMRVEAMERLNAAQSRRNQAVIETLVETEAELKEAQTFIGTLIDELKHERDQVQRLLGRLEERDTLLAAFRPETASDSVVLVAQPVAGDEPAMVKEGIEADHPPGNHIDDAAVPADQPVARDREPEQPIDTTPPIGGQAEMLLRPGDDVDQAVGGIDNDS